MTVTPSCDVNCMAAPEWPASASASGCRVSWSAEDSSGMFTIHLTVAVQCIVGDRRVDWCVGTRGDIGAVVE